MKLLVVDDSITMRRIITNMLKTSGYEEIVEAGNGREALSLMEGIDLVLTDWNMPVMDGLSFLKALRADPAYSGIPVIIVTTEGAQEEVLEALRSGASDYVVKPFSKSNLIKKIENFLPLK